MRVYSFPPIETESSKVLILGSLVRGFLAEKRSVDPAQIALAWILYKPGVVSPIIGAGKMAYVDQAVGALDIDLSEADMAHLEEGYQPHPVLGHL